MSNSKVPQITLLPIGAGQPRVIAVSGLDHVHNGWARFLPDGEHLAINGDQSGHHTRCYIVETSSGKAVPVTPEGVLCGPPSPDGAYLVGTQNGRSSTLYSLTGGSPRRMPTVEQNFIAVQWSSDGAALYGYHPGEFPSWIYRIEIATGKETSVKELKPLAPAGVVTIAPVVVSRDGTKFFYSYNQSLSVLYFVSGLQ